MLNSVSFYGLAIDILIWYTQYLLFQEAKLLLFYLMSTILSFSGKKLIHYYVELEGRELLFEVFLFPSISLQGLLLNFFDKINSPFKR